MHICILIKNEPNRENLGIGKPCFDFEINKKMPNKSYLKLLIISFTQVFTTIVAHAICIINAISRKLKKTVKFLFILI